MAQAIPDANYIRDLFDRIAPVYDDFNQALSFGLHKVWKQMAVDWSGAQPGMNVLDVCCGSGDLALLLARQVGPQGQVTGADFAVEQLAIASQRAAAKGYTNCTNWIEADALSLPFDAEQFDALTMGYGLRNLIDISQGLKELQRVLKPGARAAILDFHQPSSALAQQFQQWYLNTIVVPTAKRCGLTEEYAYIGPSVERFPIGSEQIALAKKVGFRKAVHYPLLGGMMGVLVAQK
ncbi:ubiquinone menaquinone biosynthesis methyltransferase [Leptolyngbya sp. Heron Island J]|uniref:bifunctional demethylmenaquinone methyltransferase/2-methoxy-6-polyprenyl-1,4-benzoquinol methylase UbiE n=1 Tax=Leptolyngbya sp. Heron Island J TaxID=1385935 RepID=UPI0003B9993F|nr:bifunctional demethylmenaquinone methyltransferase/2-methoxy-6-polyprenyl-1,4-benzoquinol methylase UbiE [Leptolyngbya sp. Heron Island J]ESA34820.1 ubiquinone menaquinone biosynthesis methyltransferase [Leptolyngbya sp. Heron Island J]